MEDQKASAIKRIEAILAGEKLTPEQTKTLVKFDRFNDLERGTYKAPGKKDVNEQETKKVEKPAEEKMTSPEEYFGTPEDGLKKQRRAEK